MFLTRAEYDRGVNTFAPEGRLYQVEYAIEAIKLGSTAIGIETSQGVVLAAEKRITSPLMVPNTVEKIAKIDTHLGCATSGLMADARTLIEHARVECQNHWFVYDERMSIESCAQAVSTLAIQFGDSTDAGSAMSRPFGVAILFAGVHDGKPQLWHMDPSGTYVRSTAKAIGSGGEAAQHELEKDYVDTMTLENAIEKAVSILKSVMEESLSSTNVEVMIMKPNSFMELLSKEQIEEYIKKINE